jgi:hypothetical protein
VLIALTTVFAFASFGVAAAMAYQLAGARPGSYASGSVLPALLWPM